MKTDEYLLLMRVFELSKINISLVYFPFERKITTFLLKMLHNMTVDFPDLEPTTFLGKKFYI